MRLYHAVYNIKSKYLIIFIGSILLFIELVLINYDLPSFISSSRGPWIDESLKNYISKNILEFGTPKPYANNEYRPVWTKGPVYTSWSLIFTSIFGIGYKQVRIFSVMTTLLATGFFYLLIRKDLTNRQVNLLITLFDNFVSLLCNIRPFFFELLILISGE